ncbi:MAG: hypothetical protein QOF97_1861 [Acidimicrobiaceae bacterium]|jgi:DNA-binding GntR family transcriptional regulator
MELDGAVESRGEQAARLIRRRIFDGELRPGDRVPQDDIAADLGVSRIPVREALIILQQEGWVTIAMNRGAFIAGFDEVAVRDHYNLFGVVYGFAARRALERDPSRALIPRLREIQSQRRGSEDPFEMGRWSVAFNAAVVEASASSRVKVILRSMTALVPGDFFALVAAAAEVERAGTGAVLAALERSDPAAVTDVYARMMHGLGEKVVAEFSERGLLARPRAAPQD